MIKKIMLLLIPLSVYANLEDIFTDIYLHNKWNHKESFSGATSSLNFTKNLREKLPELLDQYNISTIFDAACGDFNWVKEIPLENRTYIGGDIVQPLVKRNQTKYGSDNISFVYCDITTDPIPQVDLIIFRFTGTNLSHEETLKVLDNFKKSGSQYLLMTTYSSLKKNIPIKTGVRDYRINLELPPFNFPEPLHFILERKRKSGPGVGMGLWKLDDIVITH